MGQQKDELRIDELVEHLAGRGVEGAHLLLHLLAPGVHHRDLAVTLLDDLHLRLHLEDAEFEAGKAAQFDVVLPEHFGVVALAGVVIGGAQVILGFGIADALVQGEEMDERRLASAFWCNVIVGCVLMLIVMVSAPPIAAMA